jgi:FkbM family methyltransferase
LDILSERLLEYDRQKRRSSFKSHGRAVLKRIRSSQPFNYLATSLVKGVFEATGRRSELVIKHLHRVGHVNVALPNRRALQLSSMGDDWISNQIYWRGWAGYEPETVPLFYRLATHARTTLDVGAYVGYYTLLAAHANPAAQVFAFEPLEPVYERLQRNIKLNLLDNAQCIRAAVGDFDGESDFYHCAGEIPCSSSLSFEFMRSVAQLRASRVAVITLDQFVRENGVEHVDLMKIDTETTEPQVLRGMMETIRRDTPAIICEVLGRGSEQALEQILGPLGYRYYLLTPEGPAERDHIDGHPEWLNYLFSTMDPPVVKGLAG